MRIISLYTVIILINSCSTLSKEDCLNMNWYKQGKKDALHRVLKPKTDEYRSECSEHGHKIESLKYLKGFEVGLKKYCTFGNGLLDGGNGEERHIICEETNDHYRTGYLSGHREFLKEKVKEDLESEYSKTCSFNSDCMKEGSCVDNKCEKSGNKCTFDSDCSYEGECGSVSRTTDYGDYISINVCKN